MNGLTIEFDGEIETENTIENLIVGHKSNLCRVCPNIQRDVIEDNFRSYSDDQLIFATITLGYKKYIEMEDRELHKKMTNIIRCNLNKIPNIKYIFVAEYNKSKILHYHGIVTNELYQGQFIKIFKRFGSRNEHNLSFLKLKDKKKKIDYIMKDQFDRYEEGTEEGTEDYTKIIKGNKGRLPWIHNLKPTK